VREKVAECDIELEYIITDNQIADRLTKMLPKDKFYIFRKALRLEFTIAGTTGKGSGSRD
jgi:hypothetical protein